MESQKEQALHPLLLPLCVLVCGGAMIGVFRLLGKLDDSVLYGAALGCGICILNLFLLRFTMTRAAAAASPQAAQHTAPAAAHLRGVLSWLHPASLQSHRRGSAVRVPPAFRPAAAGGGPLLPLPPQ